MGWDNADLYARRADIRFDFDKPPYPIMDGTYDFILCNHILEHLFHPDKAMMELHRIAKPGATIEINVPHYTKETAYSFHHHSFFSTGAIYEFQKGVRRSDELVAQGGEMDFMVIKSSRKLRMLGMDVSGTLLDSLPIWSEINWVIKKV